MALYAILIIGFFNLNNFIIKSIIIDCYFYLGFLIICDFFISLFILYLFFLAVFILFNKFNDVLLYFFKIIIFLNNFDCICDPAIPIF